MTPEEKAKRYDEALKIAKKNYMSAQDLCKDSKIGILNVFKNTLERIFPELKESEDEKIRKAIIKSLPKRGYLPQTSITVKNAIAWLEKQGEQKSKNESTDTCDSLIIKSKEFPASEKRDFGYFSEPVDKVEPKFKVGDWIVFNGLTLYIKEVVKGFYRTISKGDGIPNSYDWDIDNVARLWTIQDAKDGDVLCYEIKDELRIFIYEKGCVHYHCCYYNGRLITVDSFFIVEKYLRDYIHPATKEQRDFLFSKMRETGCKWDDDKKELKKIEPNDAIQEERKY